MSEFKPMDSARDPELYLLAGLGLAPAPYLLPVEARAPRAGCSSLARQTQLVFLESRPRVQGIFLLRFLVGVALTGAATWSALPAASVWVAATIVIYVLNGLSDIQGDRHNGSGRPLASGRLTPEAARLWIAALLIFATTSAVLISTIFTVLLLTYLALGVSYSVGPLSAKNTSGKAALTVLVGGLITYAAGHAVAPGPVPPSLLVLALTMSGWMSVGSLVKDLPDSAGDARSGRRTLAVLHGDRAVAVVASSGAALVASFAWCCAVMIGGQVIWILAAVMAAGAGLLIVTLGRRGRWGKRIPYHCFMCTQYMAHGLVLVTA